MLTSGGSSYIVAKELSHIFTTTFFIEAHKEALALHSHDRWYSRSLPHLDCGALKIPWHFLIMHRCGGCTWLVNFFLFQNLINITNKNYYSVQIVDFSIQAVVGQTVMGKNKITNMTAIEPRSMKSVSFRLDNRSCWYAAFVMCLTSHLCVLWYNLQNVISVGLDIKDEGIA